MTHLALIFVFIAKPQQNLLGCRQHCHLSCPEKYLGMHQLQFVYSLGIYPFESTIKMIQSPPLLFWLFSEVR